jgi:hypothetical protein
MIYLQRLQGETATRVLRLVHCQSCIVARPLIISAAVPVLTVDDAKESASFASGAKQSNESPEVVIADKRLVMTLQVGQLQSNHRDFVAP